MTGEAGMVRAEIVLGLDDSPAAAAALRWAAAFARRTGLRLAAIHVSPFLAGPPSGWSAEKAPPERRSDYELGSMAGRTRTMFASIDPDPEWSLHFLGGTPGRTLVNIARDARLLALGAREHTGIGRLLAGSVSHYCLSHSAVPVAAVPASREPEAAVGFDEVVVGLDDSPSGIAALSWAAAWARRSGGRLRAVHVLGWPMGYVPKDYPAPAERSLSHSDVDREYRASISQLFDKIDPEPSWLFEFAEGHPGKVLVQRSSDAALLVMGTQEMVGLGRILMGSVSHHCLSHAGCPVVAVPAVYPAPTSATRSVGAYPG
jgi:nucleotide-binding universal stress UspA family protein